jgi:hypothetical protein
MYPFAEASGQSIDVVKVQLRVKRGDGIGKNDDDRFFARALGLGRHGVFHGSEGEGARSRGRVRVKVPQVPTPLSSRRKGRCAPSVYDVAWSALALVPALDIHGKRRIVLGTWDVGLV